MKTGVVKISSTLGVEVKPSIETVEQPFYTKMQELLKAGKVIAACDPSVKNVVMVALWVIMARDKEDIMSHEIHAKEWYFNTSNH